MMHKLMIKTHLETNLKYLCYTCKEGKEYDTYKGSGKAWKQHLKKFGDNIKTELIFETNDIQEFKRYSIQKSLELNIVSLCVNGQLVCQQGEF